MTNFRHQKALVLIKLWLLKICCIGYL